jgi:queuine tRNA-ribosyltransferase
MERSMRWARRCHDHYYRDGRDAAPGDLFGIVQGGMYPQLRRESLEALMAIDLPGLAVGGLAVGEPEPERLRVLEELVPHMPTDRPRYLMGVGRPEDIVAAARDRHVRLCHAD